MQQQLVKGLYTRWTKNPLFGLTLGQTRPQALVNGIWYNQNGERLGRGGLDEHDMRRIAQGIDEIETFFVLPETAASEINPDHVPQAYIAQNAIFGIERGSITFFNRSGKCVPELFDLPSDVKIVEV